MSSTFYNIPWMNACGSVRRFRYIDFLIKSSPALSLGFVAFITFKDLPW